MGVPQWCGVRQTRQMHRVTDARPRRTHWMATCLSVQVVDTWDLKPKIPSRPWICVFLIIFSCIRNAVCEPRDLPFSCQPSNFYWLSSCIIVQCFPCWFSVLPLVCFLFYSVKESSCYNKHKPSSFFYIKAWFLVGNSDIECKCISPTVKPILNVNHLEQWKPVLRKSWEAVRRKLEMPLAG